MLKSLRARLLASYVVVLVLTLIVIVVALFVLLQARPVQSVLITDRLISALQTTLQNWDARGISGAPANPSRIVARTLSRYAGQTGIRILITTAGGVVAYDSVGYDTAKDAYDLKRGFQPGDPIQFVPDAANTQITPDSLARGTYRDSKSGVVWLYVGQVAPGDASETTTLLTFSVVVPRASLAEIIRYYGSDIFVPLFEAGLIGLIVAFVFAVVIARSVALPLQKVADIAAEIAQGNLDRKAPVTGPDEVRVMAIAFNQMTEQVAATQQAQREFLANVSHDLRTPLTSIRGFSQAIIDGVAANPQSALRAATIIHDEAARMYRMVEELLDLARVEAGRLAMTRHAIAISDILSAIRERLTPPAQEKGLTLTTEIALHIPTIAGDGDRLAQVFTNLIDNAIKHTPAGGKIILRAAMQDGGVLVSVEDNGEGIPAEDLPRIFDRFYQVDKSRQRRSGAGLGLAITKQIVTAHSGRIWAESQEGAWTRFNVWLPLPNADSSTIMRRRPEALKRAG